MNANMVFTWRRAFGAGLSGACDSAMTFVPAVIEKEPGAVVPPTRPATPVGRMEIALAGGHRVIVGADVEAAALARVIAVLARR